MSNITNTQANSTKAPAVNIDPLVVVEIAIEAGRRIIEIYKTDFKVEHKEDDSPLTQADLQANRIIKEGLARLTPEIPVLSEESLVPWEVRRQWQTLWVVDPLDGTKEFVNRTDEFTVNIALVKDKKPILGVVHAPALNVTYFATAGGGAYKIVDNAVPVKIQALPRSASGPVKVVGSRSHQSTAMAEYIDNLTKARGRVDFIKSGSALKFCLVADGTADMYPRLAPTSEWDSAAGHIVVNESGKTVHQYGRAVELVYNKEDLLNPWFICS